MFLFSGTPLFHFAQTKFACKVDWKEVTKSLKTIIKLHNEGENPQMRSM